MDLVNILSNAMSPDKNLREPAEQQLRHLENANFPQLLHLLATQVSSEQSEQNIRRLAGIVFKNTLDTHKDQNNSRRWLSIDPAVRQTLKETIISTFNSPSGEVRFISAQIVAKIAVIELPEGQWTDLVQLLLNAVTGTGVTNQLKQASLEALGFICEEIDPSAVKAQSNLILTAVVSGMNNNPDDIVLAATTALFNALEFAKDNFEVESERNIIMQIVCQTTRVQNEKIREAAYQCLVKIATLYYEKLVPYMQVIFNLTLSTIKEDTSSVAMQAIEFWCSVCEEEIEIIEENESEEEENTRKCENFVKMALKGLVPILTTTMTKQEEDADEDSWNEAMAASTCLSLVANTVQDDIVAEVMPFVNLNITSQDWRFREAAILAFGAILEGPKSYQMRALISQSVPHLLGHLRDANVAVKDTTAWTLGRVCQLHFECIDANVLPTLVQALLTSCADPPRVANNACFALHNIASNVERDDIPDTSIITPFFGPVVQVLIQTSERRDADEHHLRHSAFEAIGQFVRAAPLDCTQFLLEMTPYFIQRFESTFQIQTVNADDRDLQHELQILLCSATLVLINRLKRSIQPFADALMTLYLRVFQIHAASVHEEALMAVGALATVLEADFEKYLTAFLPFLSASLNDRDAYTVCSSAVAVLGDVCRALNDKITPFLDPFIQLLLDNLKNPILDRSVKPPILAAFGDIALAINGRFEAYLAPVVFMLQQASGTARELAVSQDQDLIEYSNELLESIFNSYTGIIQGLRTEEKAHLLLPYVEQLVMFIELVFGFENRSDPVTKGAVGVLGDLAHALTTRIKILLKRPIIEDLIQDAISSESDDVKAVGKWTRNVINQIPNA